METSGLCSRTWPRVLHSTSQPEMGIQIQLYISKKRNNQKKKKNEGNTRGPEPRAIGDHTWKMRFLRRRALVCEAKLGGLGAPAAAADVRAAEEGGSMAPRQFLVRCCCFFISPWTRWRRRRNRKHGELIGANGGEMLLPATEENIYNFRVNSAALLP